MTGSEFVEGDLQLVEELVEPGDTVWESLDQSERIAGIPPEFEVVAAEHLRG